MCHIFGLLLILGWRLPRKKGLHETLSLSSKSRVTNVCIPRPDKSSYYHKIKIYIMTVINNDISARLKYFTTH